MFCDAGESSHGVCVLLLQLLVQFIYELLEDERIDILAKLIEEEPVAALAAPKS